MKNNRKFLLIFISTLLICCLIKMAIGFYIIQKAAPIAQKEAWLLPVTIIKQHIAEKQVKRQGPHIFILAGSSALYGIDNAVLEKIIGLPIINMGLHAGMPLNYVAKYIFPLIQKGDVVVMPLEWEYYTTTEENTKWFRENLYHWNSFIRTFPLSEQIQWAWYAPFKICYDFLFSKNLAKAPSKKDIISAWQNREKPEHELYDFRLLDLNGSHKIQIEDFPKQPDYFYLARKPKHRIMKKIVELRQKLEAKGATVLFTYPIMIRSPIFNAEDKETQKRLAQMQDALMRYNIQLIGEFDDFLYEKEAFANTGYHLKKRMTKKHSAKFGKMLKNYFLKNNIVPSL